jgi:hypothetical protein
MFVSFSIVSLLHEARIARDTQAGLEAEKLFNEMVASSTAAESKEEPPLLIEEVDMARNTSGRGVFQAKIVPDEVLTNTPTTVTVSAEIGSVRDVESVRLYSLSDTLTNPVLMYDNGENGDLRANDTIFTTQEEISISTPRKISYEIEVLYTDGYRATSHQTLQLQAYEPLPTGASTDAAMFAKQAEDKYLTYRKTMNADSARTKVLAEVRNDPNVSFAELADEDLSIIFKGLQVFAKLYGPIDGPPID